MIDKFWKAAIGACGVAGVGAFVFWSLYKKWLSLPIFAQLTADQTFALMLVFLGLTFLALIAAFLLQRSKMRNPDDVHALYEKLRVGLSSPEENIEQIERIANSSDPKKKTYLREIASMSTVSFIEGDAISLALDDLDKSKTVRDLKLRARETEQQNLEREFAGTPESYRALLMALKYWRYVSRKDNPTFEGMERLLAAAILDPNSAETKQIAGELKGVLANLPRFSS